MNELTIRKIIAGITVNTDTSHCFHLDVKLVSEQVGGQIKHRRIVQGLYQTPDGKYFLAFWNKPSWDNETLSFDFVDDALIVEPDQAKQWIRNYCPDQLNNFIAAMGENDKPASMQTLTLRLNTDMRNHLTFLAKIPGQSLNKLCLTLITDGMSMSHARERMAPPPPQYLTMPGDRPALDQFEKALKFDNPDEQALAGYAESLYKLWHFNYPGFLPFALHTLYRLIHFVGNEAYVLCFAKWLSQFHRSTFDDAQEYYRRRGTTTIP